MRHAQKLSEPQGTPVLIIDEANNTVSKINLDEWGNVGDKTSGSKKEINLTGKRLDPNTGLYYFNQRYYDPELGRFLTEDPKHQAFNPYLFCGNNPLMYVDPDGEFWWVVGAIIGAVVANWGKPVTFENTLKGMVIGAAAGYMLGGVIGGESINIVGSLSIKWGDIAVGVAFGATLGTINQPQSPSKPNTVLPSLLATGVNRDFENIDETQGYANWAKKLGANEVINPYNHTGITDGVWEVLRNDLGFKKDIVGDYNTLYGYSGGGHSINMAIRSGRATARNIEVFGSGLTGYEGIQSHSGNEHWVPNVTAHLSVMDPVSWLYFTRGFNGHPGIIAFPIGTISGVNYQYDNGKFHDTWHK